MTNDARLIMEAAISDAMPGKAVRKALKEISFSGGRVILIAAGKAAWEMASAAADEIGDRISHGVVITKYGHSGGPISKTDIYEAGHPIPDENSYASTRHALDAVQNLSPEDNVLFLLSGGGSALFELPLITADEMADITRQLLSCGASITEINTIRKRLSGVKGGRFAIACRPAHVFTVVLSDIIGDPLDMIASGPAYPDSSTCEQALEIASRYSLKLSEKAQQLLSSETPKTLDNVTTYVTGSVKQLCRSASDKARQLGYKPVILTSSLDCEAKSAGEFLSAIAREHNDSEESLAFFAGGETVVHLTGSGKGGRNQEIALAAAEGIAGCRDTCVFSFGSDGTDGPTDAAGGYVDEKTAGTLLEKGFDIRAVLADNDSYTALSAIDGLIITGPTGTNVNDLSAILIKR